MDFLSDIDKQIEVEFEKEQTLKKIDKIIYWAEDNQWFNTSMVMSFRNQIDKGRTLSEKQVNALESISEMVNRKIEENDTPDEGDGYNEWEDDSKSHFGGDKIPF